MLQDCVMPVTQEHVRWAYPSVHCVAKPAGACKLCTYKYCELDRNWMFCTWPDEPYLLQTSGGFRCFSHIFLRHHTWQVCDSHQAHILMLQLSKPFCQVGPGTGELATVFCQFPHHTHQALTFLCLQVATGMSKQLLQLWHPTLDWLWFSIARIAERHKEGKAAYSTWTAEHMLHRIAQEQHRVCWISARQYKSSGKSARGALCTIAWVDTALLLQWSIHAYHSFPVNHDVNPHMQSTCHQQ